MTGWRERWAVSWSGVSLGGGGAVVLTALFVTVVTSAMEPLLPVLPEFVGYGVMLLLVGCLRAVAGTWAAVRHRRRHEVVSRTEFLPTAMLAGVVGWAGWLALTGLAAHAVGGTWLTPRSVLEVFRWMAELAVGSLLVSPEPAEPQPRTRAAVSAGAGAGARPGGRSRQW